MRHLVLSSNRWFSAASDYCLQLMSYLSTVRNERVVFGAPLGSPLEGRCEKIGVEFHEVPLWPSLLSNQLRSWRKMTKLLKREAPGTPLCVWTFEGREHTLCAFHRLAHPHLWKNRRLIRVRGQAARARSSRMARWLYGSATDRVVFAARVVRDRTPISIPESRMTIQPYCVDWRSQSPLEQRAGRYAFAPGLPNIDFSAPVFLVLGRYDPVKGHGWLLESFARMSETVLRSGKPVQLVFIGKSENVQASDLHAHATRLLGNGTAVGNRYFSHDRDDRRRVFIFDERLADASIFVRQSSFGLIPSLGSEVICRVAVEFLQAGTPVVASQVGALPEVLPPESGSRTVPAHDVDTLRVTLEECVTMCLQKAEEYQALRKKARDFGRQTYALERLETMVRWACGS